jgi:serine protease AprX
LQLVEEVSGDGAVWHKAFDGSSWGNWDSVGGGCISAPAAAGGSNGIDLYVIGGDHAVYHNAWNNAAWQGWFSLGGYAVDGVAATTWPDVYTIGGDGALYRNAWTGSAWSGWVSLGGRLHLGTRRGVLGPWPY